MLKRFFSIIVSLTAGLLALAAVLVLAQHPAGTAWAAPDAKPFASTLTMGTDCFSIQACIDIANPGDEVHVPAGLYTESLTVAKDISLTGDLSSTTIIHALDSQRVMTITGASVYLADLTLTGGLVSGTVFSPYTQTAGGGVYAEDAQVSLDNVAVNSNTASDMGGGLFALTSTVVLTGVDISGNNADEGAGIGSLAADIYFYSGVIHQNFAASTGGGIAVGGGQTTSIFGQGGSVTIIHGPGGGSVYLMGGNIISNSAEFAAGVRADSGFYSATQVVLSAGLVASNTAVRNGGGSAAGGIWVDGTNPMPAYFTQTAGSIERNTAQESGGIQLVQAQGWLEGGDISFNSAYDGAGVFLQGSAFTQTGGAISSNNATYYGGGLAGQSSRIALVGGSVTVNTAQNGGGLFSSSGNFPSIPSFRSDIILDGGQVASNTAGGAGGGFYLYGANGNFTYTSGSLAYNTAITGGGIYQETSSATLIDGGQIFSNSAQYGGGIASIGASSRLTLTSGSVVSNAASNFGGGIYVVSGTMTLDGVDISQNGANNGGGIYNQAGVVALYSGSIASNTATSSGGGVYMSGASSLLTLTAGSVEHNLAINSAGGGISLQDGHVALVGGQVFSNEAAIGGGVAANPGIIELSGSDVFSNSGAISGDSGGGVYLDGDHPVFTQTGGTIRDNAGIECGGLCARGGSVALLGGSITGNSGAFGAGVLAAANSFGPAQVILSGGVVASNTAINQAEGGGIDVEGSNGMPAYFTQTAGSIKYNSANESGGLQLVNAQGWLEGGDISFNRAIDGAGVFLLGGGSAFTQTGGTIASNSALGGGGGIASQGSRVTLLGGSVVSNSAHYAGGVFSAGGNFPGGRTDIILDGGQVASNTASGAGGGFYLYGSNGNFTYTSGSLEYNTAITGGGVYQESGSAAMINGGQIFSNSAQYGGGIASIGASSRLTLTSGSVVSNSASIFGGGIYQEHGQSWLSGGQIISNSADLGGGGVAVYGTGATFTLTTGTVQGNAAPNGGGVWNDEGQVILVGGGILSNTAHNGGGIYSSSDISGGVPVAAQVVISGGLVASNTASVEGGGVYLNGPVSFLTQTAGAIEYNTAFLAGGLSMEGGQASLTGADIVHNQATTAGGVAVLGPDSIFNEVGGQISSNTNGAMLIGNTGAVTVTITGTLISSNTGSGSAVGGIVIDRGSLVITNSRILSNTSGTGAGFLAQDAPANPVSVSMSNNCISGNSPLTSVVNANGPTIDARSNWWGAADGPSGAGPGTGDSVSSGVDFSGFLSAPPVAGCLVATVDLTVTTTGSGTGAVTSTPGNLNCGADCEETFSQGMVVTLTATPSVSSTFTGWAGACGGAGACVVTLTQDVEVTATFTLNAYLLTVGGTGTGSGVISSTPAGINCGNICGMTFLHGTVVSLTAQPALSSTFTGWQSACAGVGACVLTLTQPSVVTATFALKSYTVTVSLAGTGNGAVTSAPAGINCGNTCAASFTYGTPLTLTATPTVGSSFVGWSGACGGAGACGLIVTQALTLTATFNVLPPEFKIYLPMVTRGAAAESARSARAGRETRGAILPEERRGRERAMRQAS